MLELTGGLHSFAVLFDNASTVSISKDIFTQRARYSSERKVTDFSQTSLQEQTLSLQSLKSCWKH